jgi:hypothetical protein
MGAKSARCTNLAPALASPQESGRWGQSNVPSKLMGGGGGGGVGVWGTGTDHKKKNPGVCFF